MENFEKFNIKEYANIDFDADDDTLLPMLSDAAVEYLRGAGVEPNETNSLYKLAVNMIVAHWYDNRGVLGKGYELPFGFMSIVAQLRAGE